MKTRAFKISLLVYLAIVGELGLAQNSASLIEVPPSNPAVNSVRNAAINRASNPATNTNINAFQNSLRPNKASNSAVKPERKPPLNLVYNSPEENYTANPLANSVESKQYNSGELNEDDPEQETFKQKLVGDIRQKLHKDLSKYCLDYCNILSIAVKTEEQFEPSRADFGFENAEPKGPSARSFRPAGVQAEVIVDSQFGTSNLARLQKLFARLIEKYEYSVDLIWTPVNYPENIASTKSEQEVREEFSAKIRNQIERIILEYCPYSCKLNNLNVRISRAAIDEMPAKDQARFLFARDGKGILYVQGVQTRIALNSEMEQERKIRLEVLLREALEPYGDIQLNIKEIPFPKSAQELQKDADDLRKDPYGVEKLGALLKVFRDNMQVKEVNNSVKEVYKEQNSEQEKSRSIENTNNSSTNSSSSEVKKENLGTTWWTQNNILLVTGMALTFLIVFFLGYRFIISGAKTKAAINEAMQNSQRNFQKAEPSEQSIAEKAKQESLLLFKKRLEIQNLLAEIKEIMVMQPKVAKDVFGRIIRDDGVEYTAKCVAIFGEMIILELLSDLELKNELAKLSDFVYMNAPFLEEDEQLDILKHLKMRMTAGKMRLMANKNLDAFEFIKAYTPGQIRDLILAEEPRIQGIILTQLGQDVRRNVFNYFNEEKRAEILRELCNAESMPREYLQTVAEHLKKKTQTDPVFNSENLRGLDVMLDLMERSSYEDQRRIISELDATSPDNAGVVRSKLISCNTLYGLKEGAILSVFIDMDPQAVVVFLSGANERLKNFALSRVPQDIAQNWVELLSGIRSVDWDGFKSAEMQVIEKIRNLNRNGTINLTAINTMLFPITNIYNADNTNVESTSANNQAA